MVDIKDDPDFHAIINAIVINIGDELNAVKEHLNLDLTLVAQAAYNKGVNDGIDQERKHILDLKNPY